MKIHFKTPWFNSMQSRWNGNYLLGVAVDLLARSWCVSIGLGFFEVQISGEKRPAIYKEVE